MNSLKQHLVDNWVLHLLFTLPITSNIVCWLSTGYMLSHYIN